MLNSLAALIVLLLFSKNTRYALTGFMRVLILKFRKINIFNGNASIVLISVALDFHTIMSLY